MAQSVKKVAGVTLPNELKVAAEGQKNAKSGWAYDMDADAVNDATLDELLLAIGYVGFVKEDAKATVQKMLDEAPSDAKRREIKGEVYILLVYMCKFGPSFTNERLKGLAPGMREIVEAAKTNIGLKTKDEVKTSGDLTGNRLEAIYPKTTAKIRRKMKSPASGITIMVWKDKATKDKVQKAMEAGEELKDEDLPNEIKDPLFLSTQGVTFCKKDTPAYKIWLEWAKLHNTVINRKKAEKPELKMDIIDQKVDTAKADGVNDPTVAALVDSLNASYKAAGWIVSRGK